MSTITYALIGGSLVLASIMVPNFASGMHTSARAGAGSLRAECVPCEGCDCPPGCCVRDCKDCEQCKACKSDGGECATGGSCCGK